MTSRRRTECAFGKLDCSSACNARNSAAFASGSVADAMVFSRTAAARRSLTAAASTAAGVTGVAATCRDGVAAVFTPATTASARTTPPSSASHFRMVRRAGRSAERLAFGSELREQRRRLPELLVVVRIGGKALHRLDDVEKALLVGIVHRPAAEEREAVAGEVDHVDVARAHRDAFVDDLGALVDERVDQTLDDLLVADLPRRDAEPGTVLLDHVGDDLARDRVALARHVVVPAGTGLLAEAAQLAQQVGGLRVADVGLLDIAALPAVPADVVAG